MLKPCPQCGEVVKTTHVHQWLYSLHCDQCNYSGEVDCSAELWDMEQAFTEYQARAQERKRARRS